MNQAKKDRLLRLRTVRERTGLSKQMIDTLIERRQFPRYVRLDSGAVAWRESDVEAWMPRRVPVAVWQGRGHYAPLASASPHARLVLLNLRTSTTPRVSGPFRDDIAAETGLTVREVVFALHELNELGLTSIEREYFGYEDELGIERLYGLGLSEECGVDGSRAVSEPPASGGTKSIWRLWRSRLRELLGRGHGRATE